MGWAQVENGTVKRYVEDRDALPHSAEYPDGRTVSNAHLLEADELLEFGWMPAQGVTPPFDPATEVLVGPAYSVGANSVTLTWTKRARTEEEKRPDAVRAKVIGAIVELENVVSTKAAWDGLTVAARQEATRKGLLMLAKLARFVFNKFDVPE